jgi:phosphoribosylamine--glycine ligase
LNLLIVDIDGIGLDFAMRCTEHGHAVKMWVRPKNGERSRSGDGLVEKVSDWEKWCQWADLIVPTSNGAYMDRFEALRGYGYPVFGPSKESARLEIERSFGMEAFKKAGIEIPAYKMFKSLDEAEAHCWKSEERYVFKTLGSEEDKSLSYVAKTPASMINKIRSWKKRGLTLKGPCMLQTLIEGVEMGVSAWMGRDGFLRPRGENVEHKKLMPGNYGCNTGEMGTVMWYTNRSKLSRQVLDPLEEMLRRIGHIGDVDVNCIVDDQGKAWPLEFTCRLGCPAFFIMCAQHEEPVQWMLDSMNGKDTLKVSEDVFVGLVLAQGRFPHKGGSKDDVTGIPIEGITPKNWPNLHLVDAMAGKGVEEVKGKPVEKEMIVTSGEYVLCASGSGETIRKARKAAYGVVDQIYVPDPIVRDDVGEELEKQLPGLQALGFATAIQ